MIGEMLKLYRQLEKLKTGKETNLLKEQIKESLYQKLRLSFLDFVSIGQVIGFDELKLEMEKGIQIIEQQQKSQKSAKRK